MAKQKEDPMAASHFIAVHQVGPFSRGSLLTAEEVQAAFGRDPKHDDARHEAYLKASLKRLLDLGAISPAEAPEEPDAEAQAEAQAKKAEEDRAVAEKAQAEADRKAAEKHPKR
jgi:hypothetical protein